MAQIDGGVSGPAVVDAGAPLILQAVPATVTEGSAVQE
jgi:hypothetical protein